jgi:hypothetical protein
MNRGVSTATLALALLLAAILTVPLLWAGRAPIKTLTFQSSLLQTPTSANATPPPHGTPAPAGSTPNAPTVPPATVVFPTPDTPIPNAPLISEEQALAIALSQNPYSAEQREKGEITVSTKLTVHGDIEAHATGDLLFHPELPVWLVYLHFPPYQYMGGPVGKSVLIRFNTHVYEIDAATGELIGGGNAYMEDISSRTATPEAMP